MRFAATFVTLAVAALSGSVAAASEDVTLASLTIHKTGVAATVDGASLKLDAADAKGVDCSATATQIKAGVPTDLIACANTQYLFSVLAGPDATTFAVKITHITNGASGQANVATVCRSGGGDNQICTQTQATVAVHLS
ncbi:hypothetical protein F4781DRAFT_209915 [Annulohypoxylon bovei var. microspora]|nr:hypothetical protein F4781DRAFT_209915 [Annulohypoxylon bovei var. microspora]